MLPEPDLPMNDDYNFHPYSLFDLHRGTVEDTELVEGVVLDQKASHLASGVTRVEKAKIGLIQFCISPPKTDVSTAWKHFAVCFSHSELKAHWDCMLWVEPVSTSKPLAPPQSTSR